MIAKTVADVVLQAQDFLSPTTFEKPVSLRGDASRDVLTNLRVLVIPKLSAVLDQEKLLAACNLIMAQIIGPALRKRTWYPTL